MVGVRLGAFSDRAIRHERVLALAAKVKFVIDPDNPYPNNYNTGHIRASMKDGSVIEERPPYLHGGGQEPLTHQGRDRQIHPQRRAWWLEQDAERCGVATDGGAL